MELNPKPFRGPVVYGLDVNTGEGIRSETWLNGILLAASEAGEVGLANLAIHHDLQPNINVVELRVGLPGTPLDGPASPVPGSPPANAFATVVLEGDEIRFKGDTMEVTTHPFARDEWIAEELADPVMLPHVLRVTFEPQNPVITAPWAEGSPVEPRSVADQVYNESVRLAALLRDGQLDSYMNAGALRRDHVARCYPAGESADKMRRSNLDFLSSLRGEPGFAVTVASRAEARFRVQAQGRLFDWVRADGEPIIFIGSDRTAPSPLVFQFSMLGGKLTVVR